MRLNSFVVNSPMTFTETAIEQIKAKGLLSKESDYDGEIGKSLIQLLKLFQKQRHSGVSAYMVAGLFYKLVKNSGYFSSADMKRADKERRHTEFTF